MLLFFAAAWSAPIGEGLQAQIHPAGFEFLSEQLDNRSMSVGPMDIDAEISCYQLAVTDFNLDVEIHSVTLTPTANGLEIDVDLDARGTYINIVGDTGWLDTCFDFERLIELVELQNGHLSGTLDGSVVGGRLELSFAQPPVVTGSFASDIDWFPDTFVWDFVEGMVLEQATSALETQLPALVSEYTADPLLVDVFGNLPIGIDVTDFEADAGGLYAGVTVDLGGVGSVGRPLDLSPRGTSHFAVGVTEPLTQGLLDFGFQLGLLDLRSASNQQLVADLVAGLGLGPDVEAELTLGAAPAVTIDPSGMRLVLDDAGLRVHSNGADLVVLVADIAATLDVTVANGSLVLSAHEVAIEVVELEADAVLSGERAEDDVRNFLEGWVARAASVAVSGMPLYASNVSAAGYVLRVDTIESQEDGLAVWATLFDENDPAVDRIAPETEVAATPDGSVITAVFSGTDDRVGPLSYSWRLDGGGWSTWSLETGASIAVVPGFHTLEVIARDTWHNADASPARVEFQLTEPDLTDTGKGCSTTGSLAIGWMMLGALFMRRR